MDFSFRRMMSSAFISCLSVLLVQAAPRRVQAQSVEESSLHVTQTISGVNSRLKTGQFARITDDVTWRRVWFSHLGLIDHTNLSLPFPPIDFSQSSVIAIVEKPDAKSTTGFRTNRVWVDDEIVLIDYEPTHAHERAQGSRPENVFAFFVIPRIENAITLRRASGKIAKPPSDDAFTQVASFPATPLEQSVPALADTVRLSNRMLNVVFAFDAGVGNYDAAVGSPNDLWNMSTVGTTAIDFMRYSDATPSTARMRVSRHDGVWGIKDQPGIFHGYIYHNCRCVDLQVDFLDLPVGRFRAYVYAHGDAPEQNAAIELKAGERSLGTKSTSNDGTWKFQEYPFVEGVHYVTFDFAVEPGMDIHIISHRDGSDYSMFNAIQIVPIESPGKVDVQNTTVAR